MAAYTKEELFEKYSDLWWLAPKGEDTARAVQQAGQRREWAQMPIRFRHCTYFRLMTGRPALATWNYALARRPPSMAAFYAQFEFGGMKSGVAATMADVYVNRMLGHQTYIEFVKQASDWSSRFEAEKRQMFVEAAWRSLGYFQERTTMGTEGIWYGTGFLWFGDDGQGNPSIEAVNGDELLFSNPDDPNPFDVIRRRWRRRTELLAEYEGNDEACEAIINAPEVYPAFNFDDMDCGDICAYFEAVSQPLSKKLPGRRVVVVGNRCLRDEKWEDPLPLEGWQYAQMPGSQFGQGIPEQVIQLSTWVDELLAKAQDNDMRSGDKVAAEVNADVNPDAMGGANMGLVTYNRTAPTVLQMTPTGSNLVEHAKQVAEWIRQRCHVSEIGVSGQPPPGVEAAVAIQALSNIEATVFLEKIGRLETLDRRAAYQTLLMGKRLGLKFALPGHSDQAIEWKELKVPSKFDINEIEAFNIGRLSQEIPGQVEKLTQLFAQGVLDKKRFLRFLPFPDMMGLYRELNAGADDVQNALDKLVKADAFIPPSPFIDFEYAKEQVESRYDREEADGAKQDVLDRLSMWRSQLMEMQAQNATPDEPQGFAGIKPPDQIPMMQPVAQLPAMAPVPGAEAGTAAIQSPAGAPVA